MDKRTSERAYYIINGQISYSIENQIGNLTTLMEKEMTKSNVCKGRVEKIRILYLAKGSRTNT